MKPVPEDGKDTPTEFQILNLLLASMRPVPEDGKDIAHWLGKLKNDKLQ